MKQYIKIICRYWSSEDLMKNGHSKSGKQRYFCKSCHRSFQLDYRYNAWKKGVKEQILTQSMNSSGIRDIARNLKISKDTVVAELKKSPPQINPYFLDKTECAQFQSLEVDILFDLEGDEFGSFVEKKSNQRRTWYAIDRRSSIALAYHSGKRTDESCKNLIEKLNRFNIRYFYTDN